MWVSVLGVGDVWGSNERGVEKCAEVWGRCGVCGKVLREVRKSLGGWGQRSWGQGSWSRSWGGWDKKSWGRKS